MADNIQEKIEDRVIDCINSGASGRLIIFKPQKNNFGANLAVERRGEYKEKEIYFQINGLVKPSAGDSFVKDFSQESFKADRNFYLLFVCFDEIRQKTGDHVWLVPSLEFENIAQAAQSSGGKKLLRFEASLDFKKKNKYSKFIISAAELGETMFEMFEKSGKLNYKKSYEDAGEDKPVNVEKLIEFLREARRNTYAANGVSVDNPRLLGSKQFEFQRGEYFYRDVFFAGSQKFIGQEIIYCDPLSAGAPKPVWGMNYIGSTIGKLETSFLKESLLKLAEKCRLGGTCEYEKREFKYQDRGQGSPADFSGKEEIFSDGKNIYKLNYQGGLI